tara:strand:+ start:1090 stop:1380 length:291 start_codon:yes stop_codon:yes gene_type:complete
MSFAFDAYRKIKENEKLRNTRGQLFRTPELRGKTQKRKGILAEEMTPHQKRKIEQLLNETSANNKILKQKQIMITIFVTMALIALIVSLFKWAFLN